VLNNTKIKALKPKEKAYRILDTDGLYIEVRPTGKKIWRVRKKDKGKELVMTLGEFPDIELKKARELRDEKIEAMEGKQGEKFEKVARDWIEHRGFKSLKNKEVIVRRFENYVFPQIGSKYIREIQPSDILPILKKIEKLGYLELARRVQGMVSQVFRYAAKNLLCESDPAGLLAGATKAPEINPMPAITDVNGFADMLKRIDAATHIYKPIHLCLKLAPYVALRSGEIRLLKPDDINWQDRLIEIPAEYTKMGRPHLVPLCDSALEILKQAMEYANDDFLFPGTRQNRPISENTLNVSLKSLGYETGQVVFHGFRSTFSTLGREELDFDDNLIERQLAHVEKNKVKRAYDRSYMIKQRAEMMNEWGKFIDDLKNN
jgi:integrase